MKHRPLWRGKMHDRPGKGSLEAIKHTTTSTTTHIAIPFSQSHDCGSYVYSPYQKAWMLTSFSRFIEETLFLLLVSFCFCAFSMAAPSLLHIFLVLFVVAGMTGDKPTKSKRPTLVRTSWYCSAAYSLYLPMPHSYQPALSASPSLSINIYIWQQHLCHITNIYQ